MATTQLSRSDTLSFFPFLRTHDCLAGAIAPTPHDAPVPLGRAIPFRPHFRERGIQPSVDLRVNVSKVTDDSGLPARDLSIAIFVRNRAAKRHSVLAHWPIADVPQNWMSESILRISAGTEVGALLYLKKRRNDDGEKAHRLGSVLESASVRIISEQPKVTFPVIAVTPEHFIKNNLPPDALHAVRFKEGGVDRPPADAVEVWINSKYLERLTALLARPDGRAVAASMAAPIYASIARGTLSVAKLPAKDDEGLLAKIYNKIKAAFPEIDDSELLLWAKDQQNPFIEAISQTLVSLHKTL